MTSHGSQHIQHAPESTAQDTQPQSHHHGATSVLRPAPPPTPASGTIESTTSTAITAATSSSSARLKMRFNLVLALGIILGLIGASLLVAFGLWYVKPYMQVQDMKATTCTTQYATYLDKLVKCTCAADGSASCLSQYPCLQVMANLSTDSGQVIHNVTIYDSYETFQFQHETMQCSYHKCGRVSLQNIAAVEEFEKRYGTLGQQFLCYYRPSSPSYAILEIVTAMTIVHCMLWPSLALITGLTILFVHLNMDSAKSKRKTNHFNSLERPWLRHADRNYEKVLCET